MLADLIHQNWAMGVVETFYLMMLSGMTEAETFGRVGRRGRETRAERWLIGRVERPGASGAAVHVGSEDGRGFVLGERGRDSWAALIVRR